MAALAGMLGIMQTGTNAGLQRGFFPNPVSTCGVSFLVGLASMIFVCILDNKQLPTVSKFGDSQWYLFTGGILGGAYKTTAIILAPRIGFATFHIAAVAGQLTSGIVCDLLGVYSKPMYPTPFKVLCAGIVLLGTALSTVSDVGNEGLDDLDSNNTAIFAFAACLAGAVLPIQALFNSKLGANIGTTFHAVTVNFFVGSIVMWTIVGLQTWLVFDRSEPILVVRHDETGGGEWWLWTGGSMGALLIVCVTLSLPVLGAATFSLTFISTQLASAFFADVVGAFGFIPIPLGESSRHRILGIILATSAAALCNLKLPAWLGALNGWPSDCMRSAKDSPMPLTPVLAERTSTREHSDETLPLRHCRSNSWTCTQA
jgi:transporter family-2 protein